MYTNKNKLILWIGLGTCLGTIVISSLITSIVNIIIIDKNIETKVETFEKRKSQLELLIKSKENEIQNIEL